MKRSDGPLHPMHEMGDLGSAAPVTGARSAVDIDDTARAITRLVPVGHPRDGRASVVGCAPSARPERRPRHGRPLRAPSAPPDR